MIVTIYISIDLNENFRSSSYKIQVEWSKLDSFYLSPDALMYWFMNKLNHLKLFKQMSLTIVIGY